MTTIDIIERWKVASMSMSSRFHRGQRDDLTRVYTLLENVELARFMKGVIHAT